MKLSRTLNQFTLILILSLGSGIQSAHAADINLCWESFDGEVFETLDLFFTQVEPGHFSIVGKGYVNGTKHDISTLGIAAGSAVVEGRQAVGYLGVNGTEPEANGLLFVGQLRFEIDLDTLIMTTEGIGSSYLRDTMIIGSEYETDTLNPVTCPP